MPKKKVEVNNEQAGTLPEIGFVRLDKILEFFPVGKSTWWAKVKAGEYPQPVKLGSNTTAWKVDDIRELLRKHGA